MVARRFLFRKGNVFLGPENVFYAFGGHLVGGVGMNMLILDVVYHYVIGTRFVPLTGLDGKRLSRSIILISWSY